MAQLTIHNLRVDVSNLPEPILSLTNFNIPHTQQVAIMGPSGSGKSTLLNVISGLLKPSSGQVYWDRQELTTLSATACDTWRFNHVGIIMQDFYLTQGLTALENVLLPFAFRHWQLGDVRQRAYELLEKLNMPRVDSDIALLSRGEMQRVAIARALLTKPQILIADEPTASLDAENGRNITQLLLTISQQEQCTLIVATHDHFLAQQLQRQVRLENGVIVSDHLLES